MRNLSSLLAVPGVEGMLPYLAAGVGALVLLIAVIVGIKKGFTGVARRPLSWAFGCAVFAVLELFCHDMVSGVIGGALGEFLATAVMLAVALLVRFLLFAGMEKLFGKIFQKQLARAEKIKVQEVATGEFVSLNENKLQKHIHFDGKAKPTAINRLFGAISAVVNMVLLLAILASIALLVISVTPLNAQLGFIYENETLAPILTILRTYTLDFVFIALIAVIVRYGYKSGAFVVVRSIGVFVLQIVAFVGSFYLPFSPLVAEGQAFAFITNIVNYLAELLFGLTSGLPVAIPEGLVYGAVKIAIGLVLCIVLVLLVKFIGWLLAKFQDAIDESDAACVVDGIFGAALYFAVGLLVVGVVCTALYLVQYYNVYDTSVFYTEGSTLTNGLVGLVKEYLIPPLADFGSKIGL